MVDEWIQQKIDEGYTPLWCEKCGRLLALIPPCPIDAPLLYECDHYVWIPYGNMSFSSRKCEYIIERGTTVWCLVPRERTGENAEFEEKYRVRRWYYPVALTGKERLVEKLFSIANRLIGEDDEVLSITIKGIDAYNGDEYEVKIEVLDDYAEREGVSSFDSKTDLRGVRRAVR